MLFGGGAVARCDFLGVAPYSDTDDGLYRSYLSPAYLQAQTALRDWMVDAGMSVSVDAAGNMIGRYDGERDGPPLIVGSHLDSVRNAGRYDGPLGILLGVECVAALQREGRRMPFPIEIYAFGDEEGSRFPAAMLTSRAVAGTLTPDMLDISDTQGVTLSDALDRYGLSRDDYETARHGPALAYLEAHIEQGPVLEARDLPVGTVTGIAAQLRYAVTVKGCAGHAGTNSMALRRDALAAVAIMISKAEAVAQAGADDLVATVGRLEVLPGAANVVPGEVRFTLDVRAGTNADRDDAARMILAGFESIAAARQVECSYEVLQDLASSPCAMPLIEAMDEAIEQTGRTPFRLVSGAGHDAMVMAALCPTAMLFIRCAGGISHNPAESVTNEDCEVALQVMLRFIDKLGEQVEDAKDHQIGVIKPSSSALAPSLIILPGSSNALPSWAPSMISMRL
jgi:allantoate deiminase